MKIIKISFVLLIIWMILLTLCIADFNNIIKDFNTQQEFLSDIVYEIVITQGIIARHQRDIMEILGEETIVQ